MKNSKFVKTLFILGMLLFIIFMATHVLAADGNYTDITDLTSNNTTSNNTTTNNTTTNNTKKNTTTNNTTNNTARNNTLNTNALTSNNVVNTASNATGLPKTGIGDSVPVAILIVVFGVVAVYAYKKVQDYKSL